MTKPGLHHHDSWDVMHSSPPANSYWTTANIGEAAPGVQTPLSMWSWIRGMSAGVAAAGRAIGVFTERNGFDGPIVLPFYGRAAMSVDFLKLVAERMPLADPSAVVAGVLGHAPDGMEFTKTARYIPNVALRLPLSLITVPRQVGLCAVQWDQWWRDFLYRTEIAQADPSTIRALLREAVERHEKSVIIQCVGVFAAVQPVHDAMVRMIVLAGAGDESALTAPVGGAESRVIRDLWAASRDRLSVSELLDRHGFHGPMEGEASNRVWREDSAPVTRMIEQYRDRPESDSPDERERALVASRTAAKAEFLRAVPGRYQPAARALLALCERRLPLRGVAKRSMLQGLDAVRASSRRLGEVLSATGEIDSPEDIFYLTPDEAVGPGLADARELIQRRRERRFQYHRFDLPASWCDEPEPIIVNSQNASSLEIDGVGVSAGIVEGIARVVLDPTFSDVEPDEVLVAPTTDPSWASIMFISSALVVDIGGPLSHAAVVAREIGLPCVVNTRDATRRINSGDRVRVDGSTGKVTIVARRTTGAEFGPKTEQ